LNTAQLSISAGDGLGERENIRFYIPMLKRKPFACAAKACDDFVGNEEHFIFVADGAHERKIISGGNDHAAHTHDRFSNERRNSILTFAQNCFFQFTRGGLTDCFSSFDNALITIWIRRRNMNKSFHRGAEHGVIFFKSSRKCRGQRNAMIRTFARNDFIFTGLAFSFPIITRSLESGIICL
jgi:hypothetical protein